MRIDKIAIDRFGRRTHMALDGLSDQLNVVFGPNGSGKSTIIQFIKWALFGNSDEIGAKYVHETSGQASGSISFSQDGRVRTIERRDDGSRDGQWSLDGHLQSERMVVTNLMGSLTSRDFDLFFALNFEHEPDLTSLLHAASSRGLELTSRRRPTQRIQELRLRIDNLRRESERLPWVGHELAHLVDHRASLERRLVQYEDDYRRRRSSVDREYEELNRQIVDLESTIARLREQWHLKDRDVNVRRTELEEAWRTADEARREFIHQLRGELSDLENNLDRARGMLAEFQRRSSRLDGDLRDREFDLSAHQLDKEATLCMVQSLAKQLDDLRSVPSPPHQAPLYRAHHSSIPTVTAHTGALESLRNEVGRLCTVLQSDRDQQKVRAMAGEQVQLRQCESEIERWVAKLVEQRDTMAKELEEAERFGVSLVVDDRLNTSRVDAAGYYPVAPSGASQIRAVLHACDGFEPIEPGSDELLRRLASDRDLVTHDLDVAERQLRQLLDRRRELELNLQRVPDHETAALRREIAELDTKIRNAEERERLRREMERLELELTRVGDDIVPSQIVAHAAEILNQASGGRYIALHINEGTVADMRSVLVEEAAGSLLPYTQLSRGIRDQVFLSLCLAMVSALRRQGMEMPLILNDPFINIDSDRDDAMAAVIGGFARHGHQVILFTRHRHVTELFRSHQARYLELTAATQPRPVTRPMIDEVRFRSYSESPRTERPRIDERGAVSFRRHPVKNVSQYRSISTPYPSPAEPFVSEVTDKISFSDNRSSQAVYTLPGDVPLGQTGTIDQAAARQLVEFGIMTVNDFLRSSPDYIEREARRRGMPAVRPLHRWRDELSLRCLIPRLNERDARWLVSSGITSVRSLAEVSVDTLVGRLQGRSSANYDIPRNVVEDWIRSAREIHANTHRDTIRSATFPHSHTDDPLAQSFRQSSHHSTKMRRPYAWESYGGQDSSGLGGRSADLDSGNQHQVETTRSLHESEDQDDDYHSGRSRNGRDENNDDRADRERPLLNDQASVVSAELAPSVTREGVPFRDGLGLPRSRSVRTAPDSSELGGTRRTSGDSSSREGSTRTSRSARRRRSEKEGRSSSSRTDGLRFYLNRGDAIVGAPSIGPRTAAKLKKLGIVTVDQFLQWKPTEMATKLSDSRITAETIADWQAQTVLACRVPQLRGHDAQILVACGVTDPVRLAAMDPKQLWGQVGPFVKSTEGKRIIRGGKTPDLAEVQDWIAWSQDARSLHEA